MCRQAAEHGQYALHCISPVFMNENLPEGQPVDPAVPHEPAGPTQPADALAHANDAGEGAAAAAEATDAFDAADDAEAGAADLAADAADTATEPAASGPAASPAEVGAALKALFPALFGGGHKPLKLRIQADIQQRAPGRFTKAQLSAFFRRYTGATGYLIALTRAEQRVDLDGQPAGAVSDEHKTAAREELKRRRALREERDAAIEGERHRRAQLLRDYERTTLTLANFCALKGVTQEELPALLEVARKEAAEAPPPRRDDRPRGRPDGRGDGRGEGRRDGRPGGRPGGRPEGGRPAGRADGRPQDGRDRPEGGGGRSDTRRRDDGQRPGPRPSAAPKTPR